MSDLDTALSDVRRIRDQLAASTRFQGFTPAVIALTGVLAFTLAAVQSGDPDLAGRKAFFLHWILLAVGCALLIGGEALIRARQVHRALADRLINTTLRQFLPAGAGGAVCAIVMLSLAPAAAWTLPGLWQLLMAIGIWAAMPNLPRAMAISAAWYFVAGAATLTLAAQGGAVSPWSMGIPFGVGQLLTAVVLHRSARSASHG